MRAVERILRYVFDDCLFLDRCIARSLTSLLCKYQVSARSFSIQSLLMLDMCLVLGYIFCVGISIEFFQGISIVFSQGVPSWVEMLMQVSSTSRARHVQSR